MLDLIQGVENTTRLELSQTLNAQQVSSKHGYKYILLRSNKMYYNHNNNKQGRGLVAFA